MLTYGRRLWKKALMHSCKTPLQMSLRGGGSYTCSTLLRERAARISSQLPQRAQPELQRLRRRNGNRNCADLRKQVPRTRPPMLTYAGVCAAA